MVAVVSVLHRTSAEPCAELRGTYLHHVHDTLIAVQAEMYCLMYALGRFPESLILQYGRGAPQT